MNKKGTDLRGVVLNNLFIATILSLIPLVVERLSELEYRPLFIDPISDFIIIWIVGIFSTMMLKSVFNKKRRKKK